MELMFTGNLVLAVAIFAVGLIGIMVKRNAIAMFMCIELMFNAANLAFITFAQSMGRPEGVAIFLFVITVAAAEAAVGLALVLAIFRHRRTINVDEVRSLEG